MKVLTLLFLTVLPTLAAVAQDVKSFDYENEELHSVLMDLERAYDIKFNFKALSVVDRFVTLHMQAVVLEQVLSQLRHRFNLVIEAIDDRYYVVRPRHTITVCGYVRHKMDNGALEGASVRLKSGKGGTVSDTEGFFRLERTKSSDTLLISHLGFGTLVLPVAQLQHEQCYGYGLVFENYRLDEVVVQEYLAAGIKRTSDGAIQMKPNTLDVLAGLPEPDVLMGAQLLPGIESPSETASGLFIRGGSPDQNLILWDGIKMYGSNHFFGMISAFNPYITENVRIYRSGMGPEYGDRVSGVLDIGTEKEVPLKTEGGFGMNMTHADLYLKVPLSEKFGLLLSGRRSVKELFDTPAFNSFSKKVFQNTSINENQNLFPPEFSQSREDFYFTDMTLKFIAQLSERDRISISNIFTKNKLDYAFSDIDFEVNSSDRLNIRNFGSNLNWERTWGEKFSSRSGLYYSEYDFQYNGGNRYFDSEKSITKNNDLREFGINFHTDWHMGKKITLSNGYQFFSNRVAFRFTEDDFDAGDVQDGSTHGLYTQLNLDNIGKWYMDIGLRANYYAELNTWNVQPRLYLERSIGEALRIKASAELKSQAVSQVIEFATVDFGLENQVWALATGTDFPLLISDQYASGLLFEKNDWLLDVEGYYKRIDGLNSFTRGFESDGDFFSEGRSITKGIDFLLKKKINRYTTWLGYTYSKTDFSFDGLNQGSRFSGNNDITHSLTWTHAYKWKDFQFSLGWKYRTGIPYSLPVGTTEFEGNTFIDYGSLNNERLPDYHRLDISALYTFRLSKKNSGVLGKFGLSVLNLYDRRNLLNRSYRLFTRTSENGEQTTELGKVDRFSLRTTPNLILRVSF